MILIKKYNKIKTFYINQYKCELIYIKETFVSRKNKKFQKNTSLSLSLSNRRKKKYQMVKKQSKCPRNSHIKTP